MTTLDDTETLVVKSGVSFEIESRSITFVPESERHGSVYAQGPFWFLGNFQFFTLAIGFVGPSIGLSFGATVLASVIGVLFGTLFMAFHASQGPDLGLPQMIQSRAQFGYRGVIIPLIGSLFTFVGFNVVMTVLISHGLHNLYGLTLSTTSLCIGVGAALLAILGHNWLHVTFRVMFWVSLPLYLILTGGALFGAIPHHAPGHTSFSWVAFAAQFSACAAYNITYAPYVSDYTRYLPHGRSRTALVWNVYVGAVVSAVWLIVLGAWFASHLGATDGMVATNSAGNGMFPHFGTLTVLVSVAAITAAMGLNAYSGMLTLVTGIDCFRKIPSSRWPRIAGIVVLAILWMTIAISLNASMTDALYDALSIMLYLLVPWTAVNLVDYFVVRRGHYAIKDFFTPDGIYGAWGWRGIAAYGVGFAASVPFFNLTGLYEGPAAHALADVDVSWVPGLLVAATVYYLISRSLNLSREQAAIAVSNEELSTHL